MTNMILRVFLIEKFLVSDFVSDSDTLERGIY